MLRCTFAPLGLLLLLVISSLLQSSSRPIAEVPTLEAKAVDSGNSSTVPIRQTQTRSIEYNSMNAVRHPPYRADSGYAVMRRITDEQPRSIRDQNALIPEWLFEAILAPLFALWRLRLWPSFLGLNAVLVAVILLLYWAGTKDLDIAGLGIAQRTGFIGAWLSNSVVLNHCRHISSCRSVRGLKGKVAEGQ